MRKMGTQSGMEQAKVPSVGSKAIDFELPDEVGRPLRFSSVWSQGPVLLLFYPTDFGMHCSLQMNQVRDNYQRFQDLGVTVLGISTNTVHSHGTWQIEPAFAFPSGERHRREGGP